jgi:hypothetical protein
MLLGYLPGDGPALGESRVARFHPVPLRRPASGWEAGELLPPPPRTTLPAEALPPPASGTDEHGAAGQRGDYQHSRDPADAETLHDAQPSRDDTMHEIHYRRRGSNPTPLAGAAGANPRRAAAAGPPAHRSTLTLRRPEP